MGSGRQIAAEHRGERAARVLTDNSGRPRTHRDSGEALDALLRSFTERHRALEAPDMTPGRATGWTPPTERGPGNSLRDYALGDGLVHLTWPGNPGLQALERHGRLAGWIEVYDDCGSWVALIGGRLVADAADGEPWLSQAPADALTLLRLALAQRLGTP